MPRVLEMIASGFSPQQAAAATNAAGSQLAATAAGSTQGTALAILPATDYVQVTTAAASTGVRLPSTAEGSVVGDELYITNNGANAVLVYPGTGEFINGLAVNTGFSVAAGAGAFVTRRSPTLWIAL